MLEKNKGRLTRRSKEAKALQKKQYRQRIISNKKGKLLEREVQKQPWPIYEQSIGDDIQGEVSPHWSGDLGDTGSNPSEGSVPELDDEG